MFKLLLSSICISLLFVGLLCSSAFSTALVINDATGQLIGATEVLVGQDYYDVDFVDGTAWDLFYDEGSQKFEFEFTTLTEARLAAEALMQLVFVDDENMLDSNPTLTNGIEYEHYGYISTPYTARSDDNYTYLLDTMNAYNWDDEEGDATRFLTITVDTDTSYYKTLVYAIWTPSTTPSHTPEPSTILLVGSGLLGLAGLNRKKYK